MKRCVYCLGLESDKRFTKREHVLPESMGKFDPHTPTILAKDGLVCDECNEIFSKLETKFIEDSLEGVLAQKLRYKGSTSVTIQDRLLKTGNIDGFGTDFFDNYFSFLTIKDGRVEPDFPSQIKIRRKKDGCRVFLPDTLARLHADSSSFKSIKTDLENLNLNDIAILGKDQSELDECVAQLRRFGVKYNQKTQNAHYFPPGFQANLKQEFQGTINPDIGRLLAKIVFNYFAYCTSKSDKREILYHTHFDAIRSFIRSAEGELRAFIPNIFDIPILKCTAETGQSLIAHLICFALEDDHIVARLSFLLSPFVYKIIIGEFPDGLDRANFGCGHAFNPINRTICPLTQNPGEKIQNEPRLLSSFGLNKATVNF